jgi:energy-coupling factor transport system substrate-specific component
MQKISHLHGEAARFLLAGGLAAGINWLSRIGLSLFMPFGLAVISAYGIGMVVGFLLYRHFVFQKNADPVLRQIGTFVVVNAFSAAFVLGFSLAFLALGKSLWPLSPMKISEALSHGAAIMLGAGLNFVGHRWLTFGAKPAAPIVQGQSL